MSNCTYGNIDIFNPIDGKLNIFIDAFTSVYGETYRELIAKRLSNAQYFFLGGKFSNIVLKFRELISVETEKIKNDNSLTNKQKQEAIDLVNNKYEPIIKIFIDTQKELDIINFKYTNASENLLARQINNLRKENKLPELSSKEVYKFTQIYNDLIVLNKNNLQSSIKLLSDKKRQSYDNLIKVMGFKNKNLNDLVKNKSLKNDIFNEYLLYNLLNLNQEKTKEINQVNFCIADFYYQIDKLNLTSDVAKLKKIGSSHINNNSVASAFVTYASQNNEHILPICFCKNALELPIEDLTHELGHIIDSSIIENTKEGIYYKIGFELFYKDKIGYYNEKNNKINNNDGMLFNEMVNEYICQKVSKIIEQNNKSIVLWKRTSETTYALGFEIFDDFLEKHFKRLIECKLSSDKNEKTYEIFGKKNFEELTKIAREYITERKELYQKSLTQDINVKTQIESLKKKMKLQVIAIEKKINKNLEKQNNIHTL